MDDFVQRRLLKRKVRRREQEYVETRGLSREQRIVLKNDLHNLSE